MNEDTEYLLMDVLIQNAINTKKGEQMWKIKYIKIKDNKINYK
jgi:hypothetical protein